MVNVIQSFLALLLATTFLSMGSGLLNSLLSINMLQFAAWGYLSEGLSPEDASIARGADPSPLSGLVLREIAFEFAFLLDVLDSP